jgi:protein SCO1/2
MSYGEETIRPEDEYVPPDWIVWLRKHIWKIGIAMGLTFVTASHFFLQQRPEPPPVLMELPDFSLVDQDGQAFGPDQMRGKVWVVGFVFTRCQSTCPAISQSMVYFQDEYVRASKIEDQVHMLTVTVDPEYDTPERLKAYAGELGADLDHWTFITGDKKAITDFVVGGFKLAVGDKMEETEPGVFDIAHSTKLALVDRHGGVRFFSSTDGESLNELYHRLFPVMRAEPGEG